MGIIVLNRDTVSRPIVQNQIIPHTTQSPQSRRGHIRKLDRINTTRRRIIMAHHILSRSNPEHIRVIPHTAVQKIVPQTAVQKIVPRVATEVVIPRTTI